MTARHTPVLIACTLAAALTACQKQPAAPATQSTQPGTQAAAPAGKLKIALIPKGTTHEFWKSVHAGGVKAARELGNVELIWRGPEREDDREQQVTLVENFISSGISAIVLAPLDEKALVPAVRQAMNAKIPVVIIDSGLEGEPGKDYVSFAATDNYKGGLMGGERLAEVLGGKGKALLLRYQEGSNSTMERERGFVEAIAKHPGIELIDLKRYAGATRATAQAEAENLLANHGDVQGVFCPNESSSFGMLLALRARGLAGKVYFVGFDASPGLLDGLAQGHMAGLVVQDPMKMGYLGVKTAVDHLQGRPVEPRQDTGVVLVTRETMDQPEYKEVLHPDLAKYLAD
ncbi:MAG: substrate-binding domain-containing protein [Planctomycetota bacterium]